MAGIREQKKAETRKAIVAAAVALFSQKGYDKTSIEDIAKQAGIGKATVYTYFEAKDDIFLTYCDDELDEAFATLKDKTSDDAPLLEKLIEFFMIKFRFLTQNQEFGRQLIREMAFPKTVNEKAKDHDQRYFDILEVFFRSAQQRGEVAMSHDIFTLSAHFYCLYLGILSGWYGGYVDNHDQVEAWMRTLFTQTFEGIKP
jgi:AcrR family transcriptional regulator